MAAIEINSQFTQVLNFVNRTRQLIFLTGKAGTGKTTLLKYVREKSHKQLAVVAPTGVAAINAGGSTIHSFFQFPFTPFLPAILANGKMDVSASKLPALKYTKQRLNVFRNLELLIIDEISMVRADLLDQIDLTLRVTRKKHQLPFGGVQVLFIGDMYQLPPVVPGEEWSFLSRVYPTPYFFDSVVVRNHPPVYVELDKIFRQKEAAFVELLNKVRNNQMDQESLELLNSHFKADFSRKDYEENVTLTTHNRKADEINSTNLQELPGEISQYKAKSEGIFPEKNFPAEPTLVLKVGAKVMFLKNNADRDYYNGKIGKVTRLTEEKVFVRCDGETAETEVSPETWTNVSYKADKKTNLVDEEVLGTFTQFPLRLAWAITIHKSQGLTFDKVIIDAAEAFSAGQVYVALSRCRSLAGLTLSSKIQPQALINDANILSFAKQRQDNDQLNDVYAKAEQYYLQTLLQELFDFTEGSLLRTELAALQVTYENRINGEGKIWTKKILEQLDSIAAVGQKFKNQLGQLFSEGHQVDSEPVSDRIKKAAGYFIPQFENVLGLFDNCGLVTESKIAADELNENLQSLQKFFYARKVEINSVAHGFDFKELVEVRRNMIYPSTTVNVYATGKTGRVSSEAKHPTLYKKLLLVRDRICNEEQLPVYMVANQKSLTEITNYLPVTDEELMLISGFGKAKVEQFGDLFLSVVRDFMAENNLESAMNDRPKTKSGKKKKLTASNDAPVPKKPAPGETKKITYDLYKKGLALDEIARQRKLTLGTIQQHLLPYIAAGELEIDQLISSEKRRLIEEALKDFKKDQGITRIKNKLPEDVSFSEIQYVLASRSRDGE